MIHIHALYEKKSASDTFDMKYLLDKRIPFVKEVLLPYGLVDIVVHEGKSGVPGGPPKYCCIIVLGFRVLEDFVRAFKTEGERMNAGIQEFTNIEPVVVVTEVASS